jgi:hypothetical protein
MLRRERERLPGHSRHESRERQVDGLARMVRFIRESGAYPSCDRGHVNLYQPFVERSLSICRQGGRVGLVAPWGLAVDEGAAALRRRLIDRSGLSTLVGLDNGRGLFPIHRGLRFLAFVASPGAETREIRSRFGVKDAAELDALPSRDDEQRESAYPVRLTPRQLQTIGGPSRRVPDVRRPEELAFLERLTAAFPALGSPAGWKCEFGRELNATEDRRSLGPTGLPVVEGKHIEPFRVHTENSHRRIGRADARRLLPGGNFDSARLGYRDVSGVGNRLSLIAAIVPAGVVTTHTIYCLRSPISPDAMHFLCGVFNSYVLNAVVRLLMGGHLTTALVESLPVPVDNRQTEARIAQLAEQLSTRPWQASVAAELQAEVAHLYQMRSGELRRILDGFPLVPPNEREEVARLFEKREGATDVAPPRNDRNPSSGHPPTSTSSSGTRQ